MSWSPPSWRLPRIRPPRPRTRGSVPTLARRVFGAAEYGGAWFVSAAASCRPAPQAARAAPHPGPAAPGGPPPPLFPAQRRGRRRGPPRGGAAPRWPGTRRSVQRTPCRGPRVFATPRGARSPVAFAAGRYAQPRPLLAGPAPPRPGDPGSPSRSPAPKVRRGGPGVRERRRSARVSAALEGAAPSRPTPGRFPPSRPVNCLCKTCGKPVDPFPSRCHPRHRFR